MRYFGLAILCALISAGSFAQRGTPGRHVTYIPAHDASSTEGVEYRDDNFLTGRIYVSAALLEGLPFDFMMQQKRGITTHTVPAIRADVSADGTIYELSGIYHGGEMSFQTDDPDGDVRQAVMQAVDTAITSGGPVKITLVDLQSGATQTIHDGPFITEADS